MVADSLPATEPDEQLLRTFRGVDILGESQAPSERDIQEFMNLLRRIEKRIREEGQEDG